MSGPVYTYTPDTPQPSNPMNSTQPLILANFQAIAELIGVNHVGFNSTDCGKHNFISLPNTTDPGADTTEITMFSKVTGSPNPCELFIQYPAGGTAQLEQVSQSTPPPPSGTSGGNASQGWCSFPSGIIFRWGTFSCATNSNPQVNIHFTQGPMYKIQQTPACVAPTSFGCTLPIYMTIYSGQPVNSSLPVSLQNASSASQVVNFNFLLMGI